MSFQTVLMKLSHWWSGQPTGMRVLVWVAGFAIMFVAAWLLSDSALAAFLLVGILLAALGLFYGLTIVVRRLERSKGRELEASLLRGMKRGGGLDESKEEQDIRRRLEERWQQVSGSLNERGYDYYSFPWYLIIGPAQSGKTTSIQKSDQEFPIGDKPVVDFGGTRGCNWFFTNQAIIIDTAGRYVEHLGSSEDTSMLARDEEEWNTFLDLLRMMRSRSPVNGVVLTIKLEDVLEEDETERERIVEMLRKALLDIEEHLRVRVPVYVLITMADKLIGFCDFFEHLPGLGDRTLFGWSKPGAFDDMFSRDAFETGFGRLATRLERMTVEFMEQDAAKGSGTRSDLERMDRLMAFPHEFATLGPRLSDMLAQVFAPTSFNEHHFCRGVYFTSGVQEGTPVFAAARDLIADRMASFERDDIAELAGESKSYFIADLYQEKIFKEQGLIKQTRRAQSEQRRKKWAYTGVASIFLVLFTLWVITDLASRRDVADRPLKALVALTEMGPTDVSYLESPPETGKELLDRLQEFGESIAGFQERVEEAKQISAGQLGASRDNVVEAYRKAYATKVIDPLLKDFLGKLEAKPDVFLTLEGASKWAAVLANLHSLGYPDQATQHGEPIDWDVEKLQEMLKQLNVLHNKLGNKVDYDRVGALAGFLRSETGEPLGRIRRLVKLRYASVIRRILEKRFYAYWAQYADRDAIHTVSEDPTLERVRAWLGVGAVRNEIVAQLKALKLSISLSKIADNEATTLAGFRSLVSDKWTAEYAKLRGAKNRLGPARDRIKDETAPTLEELRTEFKKSTAAIEPVETAAGADATTLAGARKLASDALDELNTPLNLEKLATYDRWKKPSTWDSLDRMHRYVVYEGGPVDEVLNPKKEAFKLLKSAEFAEVVGHLTAKYRVRAPDDAPPAYSELAEHFRQDRVQAVLRNRAVSKFYYELGKRIRGKDQLEAVSNLVGDAGDNEFSVVRAQNLGKVVKCLREGYQDSKNEEERRLLWKDARGVDNEIASLARDYMDRFASWWLEGVAKKAKSTLPAYETALRQNELAGLRYLNLKDKIPDFEALITESGAQAEAGKGWFESIDDALGGEPDAATESRHDQLILKLKRVTAIWKSHEAGSERAKKLREEIKKRIETPLRAFDGPATEEEFIRLSRTQMKDQTAFRPLKEGTYESQDPIADVVSAFGASTRSALADRPLFLWSQAWQRVAAEKDAIKKLRGKFPFVGSIVGERGKNVGTADYPDVLAFLGLGDMLLLYTLIEEDVKVSDAKQKEFVLSCAALWGMLGSTTPIEIRVRSYPRGWEKIDDPLWSIKLIDDKLGEYDVEFYLNKTNESTTALQWQPGQKVEIFFNQKTDERWAWFKPDIVKKGQVPLNIIAMLYGNGEYGKADEIETGAPGVRWVKIEFQRQVPGTDGAEQGFFVLGFRFSKGKDQLLAPPKELPSLAAVFPEE
ncbi:MAG: type VI secretion protein IcmF/TssM N-terminal domain-containing protein [Planctomycetota bacterium]|jgi:hypothetical protein